MTLPNVTGHEALKPGFEDHQEIVEAYQVFDIVTKIYSQISNVNGSFVKRYRIWFFVVVFLLGGDLKTKGLVQDKWARTVLLFPPKAGECSSLAQLVVRQLDEAKHVFQRVYHLFITCRQWTTAPLCIFVWTSSMLL